MSPDTEMPPYLAHTPTSEEELIKCLTVTKKAEKGDIRDPLKSTMLFRKWFNDYIIPRILWTQGCKNPADAMKDVRQALISQWASAVWNRLTPEVKNFWTRVEKGARVDHVRLYPSYHTAEEKAKRAEERKKKKAGKSKKAKSGGPGPRRSAKGAVRSSPYPSPPVQGLSSHAIHPSNPHPIPGPSTPVDATSPPTYRPVIQPTMYPPPPPPSMAATPFFPVPPSFYPPATLPFSTSLPSSSSLVPPQSWPLPPQHPLPFSAPALPYPLMLSMPTSTLLAAPAAFPPQPRYQAPPSGYHSIPPPPNPHGSWNATDFPFSFSEPLQGSTHQAARPLPVDNRATRFSPTFFGIDESDPLLRL